MGSRTTYILRNKFRWFSSACVFLIVKIELWWFIFSSQFSLISQIICPGISGYSPRAISFNVKVIDSSNNSECSSFTPVRSPWVTNNPIFSSIFLTPSSNTNVMVKFHSSSFINKNTWSIVSELLSNSNCTSNRSTLIDFINHCLFSFNLSELRNSIDFSTGLSKTSTIWHTVFTFNHSTATNSVVMSISLIRWASLISNIVVMNPLIGILSISSTTAFIRLLAWNQNLRRNNNIRPLGFSCNFDSVTKSRSRRECPAWTAVDGNMLISLYSEEVGVVKISPPKIFGNILKLRDLSEYFGFECFRRLMCPISGDIQFNSQCSYKQQT